MNRWSPPTVEQGLSQPRYLQNEALRDPEAALDLAEREEEALLGGMPGYLEAVRSLRGARSAAVLPVVRHRAFAAIARAIEEFGTSLADHNLSRASSSRLLALERRLGLLESLNDSLHSFAAGAAEQPHDGRIGTLVDNLVEAADTVLFTTIDGWQTRDAADLATLVAMTEDRGTMMAGIRRTYGEGDAGLFHLTSLFERIVWLLRQIGLSLREAD